MQITKATLCLWLGCATTVGSVCYFAGSINVLRVVAGNLVDGELEGGKAFAINFPILVAGAFAVGGVVLSASALLVSWRVNKQPLFSVPHLITPIFLLPLLPYLVFLPEVFRLSFSPP